MGSGKWEVGSRKWKVGSRKWATSPSPVQVCTVGRSSQAHVQVAEAAEATHTRCGNTPTVCCFLLPACYFLLPTSNLQVAKAAHRLRAPRECRMDNAAVVVALMGSPTHSSCR